MSLPESLSRPAEFRGVPFHIAGSDTAVGRRVIVHEFPKKDKPFPEDMGRKGSEFIVDGFLIGDDYVDQMKRLIAVLLVPGPGTLKHPTMGTLQVVLPDPTRLREQFIQRRGMVTFSLRFVEAGDEKQPSTVVDTQQKVEDAADACYGPMEQECASKFSIDGAPAWSIESITGEINTVNDALTSVRNGLQYDLTSLSSLNRSGNMLKANLTGLLATPNALASELTAQIRGITGLFDFSTAQSDLFGSSRSVKRPMDSLVQLGTYGAPGTPTARPVIPTNTPTRRQQAANQEAIFTLVARASVVEAVRSTVYIPFDSAEDAAAVRDQLYDALDELMLDAEGDVFTSLHDLRSAMVRDISARGADLVRRSTLTLPASVPARVLSYRLYGTGHYADEIVMRNQAPATVMHPLFMPAGTPLEVRRV